MIMYKRARTVKRILYAPITILALVIFSIFLVRAAFRAYQSERTSTIELQNLEQSKSELSTRETFIIKEIDRLQSSRGLEEELRNKYPVAKQGEHVVIIVEPKGGNGNSTSTSSGSFWSTIINFFR